MTLVVVLAFAGLAALGVALRTDSSFAAVVVIAFAALGIVLLLRDWRAELRAAEAADATTALGAESTPDAEVWYADTGRTRLQPDQLTPDISTDPNGPSSNARAD